VHPLILFVDQPAFLALLNTFTAPWRARFAALSVYSLIAIVVMGVWRTKLKLRYETWHISHQ
jgi:predicted ferric reductase